MEQVELQVEEILHVSPEKLSGLDERRRELEELQRKLLAKMQFGANYEIVRQPKGEGVDGEGSSSEVDALEEARARMDALLAGRGANTDKNYGSLRASLTWDNTKPGQR